MLNYVVQLNSAFFRFNKNEFIKQKKLWLYVLEKAGL